MKLEIKEFIPEVGNPYTLGYVKVLIADKIGITAKVCNSKAGNTYIAFANIKINDVWQETFQLGNEKITLKLKEEIRDLVLPLVEKQQAQQQSEYQNFDLSDDEIPF